MAAGGFLWRPMESYRKRSRNGEGAEDKNNKKRKRKRCDQKLPYQKGRKERIEITKNKRGGGRSIAGSAWGSAARRTVHFAQMGAYQKSSGNEKGMSNNDRE